MKIKLTIILALLISLASCDSPESVAEKALEEIGNGKYRFDLDKCFMGTNDDIFSMALVHNAEAEDFLQNKKPYNKYKNLFFQTSCVFGEWKLVDKIEFPIDLYFADFRESAKSIGHEDWWDDHKKTIILRYDSVGGHHDDKELVVLTDDAIVEKRIAVPITRLRYKIDNSRIAVMDIVKNNKEYRVASFIWEK